MICLQQLYNIFTTNPKWQVVIDCYCWVKKVISMLNNKFNVQNILSSHFSPKLGGWFFVGLGGKYHPLPFHSSLISIAPNNEKLSSFISIIFHPTKLNINLVVMHSDQP